MSNNDIIAYFRGYDVPDCKKYKNLLESDDKEVIKLAIELLTMDMITTLYNSGYKMLISLSDEERDNGFKLMFSEDPECNILATEIFNNFGDSNFSYRAIRNYLNPNLLYMNC